jgi:hypothetical protein
MPMKLRFNLTVLAVAISLTIILKASDVRAVVTYDLNTDWSDVSNPNSVWSYNEGSNALPHVAAWDPAEEGGTQPAWAVSGDGSSHEFLPVWFKSVLNEPFTHDWQIGDVVVHTTDANVIGHGPANVTWTSPLDGARRLSWQSLVTIAERGSLKWRRYFLRRFVQSRQSVQFCGWLGRSVHIERCAGDHW